MSLTAGTKLGPYEIQSAIGAGGMGEVYRARDTRLNRDVALKILPQSFAADADRVARFKREAQVLASLNHSNIAAIYGIESDALVMELVEGEDLSAHIARGALSLAETLPIARQIIDALEAAHDAGIVHRDLKPANIKVRADGTVKLLDFGLAKAMDPAGTSSPDLANSPTLTARATQMGMILGTAAYMSPEQARGKAVDRRADIWAFGVVLYEMLSGRRAFEGDDISITLANVLKDDVTWSALPASLPPSVRRLLRRCLEKDPRKRLSSIGDARLELDETDAPLTVNNSASTTRRRFAAAMIWPLLAGVVITAAIAAMLWPSRRASPDAAVSRVSLLPPAGVEMFPDPVAMAISPDGRMVAFVVGSPNQQKTELWIRSLESTAARRIESGDFASLPFWSPDSRRIGFFAGGKLKTVLASGGRADVLCDAPTARGGTWNSANVIVFAGVTDGPLSRVSANGGTPTTVTTLEAVQKESGHRFPAFLPDGEHFLFTALPKRDGKYDVFVGSLANSTRTRVGSMEGSPVFAPSIDPAQPERGWLVWGRDGVLAAQPFDAKAQMVSGDAVSLADEPAVGNTWVGSPATSASASGALAYLSESSANRVAQWLDASGRFTGVLKLAPEPYAEISISPDGRRAVLGRQTSAEDTTLWLTDLARGGAAPLSSSRGRNWNPVWSPDSTEVVFRLQGDGPDRLSVKTAGDATPERLLFTATSQFARPDAWSPDGTWIVFEQVATTTGWDLWLLPTAGDLKPRPYAQGRGTDGFARVSPDGRWLAYMSSATDRPELYVQSFPVPGPKLQVTTDGADRAWWTPDGRQLIFLSADRRSLWRVDVALGAATRIGIPTQMATLPSDLVDIDAMPDRQRFLALVPERAGTGTATVVLNWQAALGKIR